MMCKIVGPGKWYAGSAVDVLTSQAAVLRLLGTCAALAFG